MRDIFRAQITTVWGEIAMKIRIAVLLLLALSVGMSSARAVGILYANDNAGNLYTVDVNSGVATYVANTGIALSDIAFDRNGTLYGIDYSSLYRVNSVTGQTTLVGSIGSDSLTGLVFDQDNVLWAAGSSLWRVNTGTGQATEAVYLAGYSSAGDLAFDAQGKLFVTTSTGVLIEVNPGTATVSPKLSIPTDVYGFARADDGTLYGITSYNELLRIDPEAGQVTYLRNLAGDFLAMTYGSSFTTEALPEPGTLTLLVLGAMTVVRRNSRSPLPGRFVF